jgi:hypothetical protein
MDPALAFNKAFEGAMTGTILMSFRNAMASIGGDDLLRVGVDLESKEIRPPNVLLATSVSSRMKPQGRAIL